MGWFILAVIGVLIGVVASAFGKSLRMPAPLIIAIATTGALVGGALDTLAGAYVTYGFWTFYLAGIALSVALTAGSFLAFNLTTGENRV